jgi:hypothetical protein
VRYTAEQQAQAVRGIEVRIATMEAAAADPVDLPGLLTMIRACADLNATSGGAALIPDDALRAVLDEVAWLVLDDALADQHARYHSETGNLLHGDGCGWEGCQFWDVAQHLRATRTGDFWAGRLDTEANNLEITDA